MRPTTTRCPVCEDVFVVPQQSGPPPFLCSAECRRARRAEAARKRRAERRRADLRDVVGAEVRRALADLLLDSSRAA